MHFLHIISLNFFFLNKNAYQNCVTQHQILFVFILFLSVYASWQSLWRGDKVIKIAQNVLKHTLVLDF